MIRRWLGRTFTAQRLLLIRDVAMVVTVGMIVVLMIQLGALAERNRQTHENNARALQILEDATSDAAREAQQQQLTTVILTVDCNNQQTLQRTVDVLVERGVLNEGDLDVITEECESLQQGE